MAYTTIDNPELFFQCKLYTGTGSSHAITLDGSEDMQPDMVWWKERTSTDYHTIVDSVRGVTKRIFTNVTEVEDTNAESLKSFDSDGFTMGTNAGANQASQPYVAWNWKAGTSFSNDASATGVGDIDSSGSVNTTAGFSIVSYTGNGTSGTEVAHGLGSTPDLYITKSRSYTYSWGVYHKDIADNKGLFLDLTSASTTGTGFRNSTAPTSSVFTLGGGSQPYRYTSNKSSETYIGYFFKSVKGYSKIGTFTGNGSASNGPYVHLGFRPAWVMIKRSGGAGGWEIYDSKRDGFNPKVHGLTANTNNAEDNTDDLLDLLSNGFKLYHDGSGLNTNGSAYIYMAFAESPFTNSNGVPNNAR